eukprot:3736547-Amphidinium_carterae.1
MPLTRISTALPAPMLGNSSCLGSLSNESSKRGRATPAAADAAPLLEGRMYKCTGRMSARASVNQCNSSSEVVVGALAEETVSNAS